MTPRENAIAALELRVPECVPTFELEFQLSQELLGRDYLPLAELNGRELSKAAKHNAALTVEICRKLEYSIIPVSGPSGGAWPEPQLTLIKEVRRLVGDEFMVAAHSDFTFSIPSGEEMVKFVYWLADNPDDAKEHCRRKMDEMHARVKALAAAGVDCYLLCCDYCFNAGPFLSPEMFAEFVTPYLAEECAAIREAGGYAIKHTDGQIMPIIDQLVAARPHALHSLDPMAGVDIAEVKRLWGGKVCLCGNVNCALMQTGTEDEVRASAEYAMKHGKPGGGYIFCTSNVPFKGLPLERYMLALDVWRKDRRY